MRVVEEKLAEAVAETKSFGIAPKLLHEILALLTGEDERPTDLVLELDSALQDLQGLCV